MDDVGEWQQRFWLGKRRTLETWGINGSYPSAYVGALQGFAKRQV